MKKPGITTGIHPAVTPGDGKAKEKKPSGNRI